MPCLIILSVLDVSQRYDQMSGWLKQQMVPIFLGDDNIPVAHGQLKRVWLGGLVNPQALFTAIMHEAAIGYGCLDDQVSSLCTLLLKITHLHLLTILNAQPESNVLHHIQVTLIGLLNHWRESLWRKIIIFYFIIIYMICFLIYGL